MKRYSGDWMVLADDRILEFVYNEGAGKPKMMAESGYVRYSRSYISKRCAKLVEHGLLRNLGDGVYVITERGEQYLKGDIDTSEDVPDDKPSVEDEKGPTEGDNHEQA